MRKWPSCLQLLVERRAIYVLHPQPDPAVDPLSAVHGDDIGMPHPRHEMPFFDNTRSVPIPSSEELQGDRPIQPRITGTIDLAKRASPDAFEDSQRSPREESATVGFGRLAKMEQGGLKR